MKSESKQSEEQAYQTVRAALARLRASLGRWPSYDELAAELGLK